jgi:subtilisin family serine protease
MSMRCLVVFLLLGLSIHGTAMGVDVSQFVDKHAGTKISSQIRKAIERARTHGVAAPAPYAMRWLDGEQIEVFIYHQCTDEDPLLQNSSFGITYAKLPYRLINEFAALACVRQIRPPVYAHRRVGSVTSAGDIVMRAEEMRATFGVDGSNIRIGIISDSLVNLSASVSTGDLPPDVIIVNGRNGSGVSGATDEGRAMAEIIHDLAPGATLLFHTGVPTSLDMIDAIRALTAAGAHIIVDDLGFFLEPYFEDGPVAQAVQEAIDAGVLYVTAVGNDAEANYSGTFQELDPDDDNPQNNVHDFGGGDGTMGVTIPPGRFMQAVLQWPNPFDGSANTADYDLLVLNADGTAEACSTPGISGICVSDDAQLESPLSPVETVFVQNDTGQAVSLNLVINRAAGEALPLRLVFSGPVVIDEHNVPDHSVFGHPCVREAMSVGAIDAADPGFDTIEPFSSRGPCEIFFAPRAELPVASTDADGFRTSQVVALIPPEIRDKPDVVAADGINTSLPLFAPLFGTSAAAPHVAAVAALLMDLGGGPEVVSASQVLSLMRTAAVDQGAPGVDDTYGFGVVNAVQMADVLQDTPQATILSPTADVVVVSGATVSFLGACSDMGHHGPFTFNWNFGGGANIESSTEQNPSVVFPLLGTFTVTLTCSNVLGFASRATTIGVSVNAADNGGGATAHSGGGGGCALVTDASKRPLSALGNIFLPLLTLGGWWVWRRWRA